MRLLNVLRLPLVGLLGRRLLVKWLPEVLVVRVDFEGIRALDRLHVQGPLPLVLREDRVAQGRSLVREVLRMKGRDTGLRYQNSEVEMRGNRNVYADIYMIWGKFVILLSSFKPSVLEEIQNPTLF